MSKEAVLQEVVRIIRRHLPESYRVFLFGSWAKGNALPTSDLDVAILGAEPVPWELMAKILHAKDEIPTLRSIDLVDLASKGQVFRDGVLQYAQPIA